MQCPYFKKINFHRIQQRIDTQQDSEKKNDYEKQYQNRPEFEFIEDSIPQQGCTNNVKVQNYRKVKRYDSQTNNYEQMQELEKCITIKMPKTLQIKQFNIEYKQANNQYKAISNKKQHLHNKFQILGKARQFQLSEVQQQLNSQDTEQFKQKQAKIFPTHRNFFFNSSFHSVVVLLSTNQKCFCHLDQNMLKIVSIPEDSIHILAQKNNQKIKQKTSSSHKHPNMKIKYYVDLKKYKLSLFYINSKCLQIKMICSNRKQSFSVQFETQAEKCTFQCVYMSILDQISCNLKQNAQKKSNKQLNNQQTPQKESQSQLSIQDYKSQRSVDSLKFSVQRISYKNAFDCLNTFDVILFKGKNMLSKVQRFLTNSQFDHVGLILRTVSSDLLLLEATGNVGVALYSFSSIQMALKKKLYQRIAIRKLCQTSNFTSDQKNKRLYALQQFVLQVNGKKYKFNPMYLITGKTANNPSQMSRQAHQNQQTYFCSSLVAEALQVCKILKKTKPSYQYLPKNFGDFQGLNNELNSGYYYSESIIIQK